MPASQTSGPPFKSAGPEGTKATMKSQDDADLNDSDRKIFKAICAYWQKNQYPPTLREIGRMVGDSSTSHVRYCVLKLVKKGMVEYEQNQARSVRPVHLSSTWGNWYRSAQRLPIIGRIQAGLPIPVPSAEFAHFDSETYVEIGSGLGAPAEQLFALQVKGDSMEDAMVKDGDIVIMQAVKEARNGQMVAAWLKQDGETTLKRFYREGDMVRLQPENSAYQPILVPAEAVEIQGVVVRLIRDLEPQ
jgi:repressor LexA